MEDSLATQNGSGTTYDRERRSPVWSGPGPLAPHGGTLIDLTTNPDEARRLRAEAARLRSLPLTEDLLSDLELLAVGAYSPLRGFLGPADFDSVLRNLRLADGTVWPLPIVLPVARETAAGLSPGQRIALANDTGPVAILEVADIYDHDPAGTARAIFGTDSPDHPGAARVLGAGPVLLGGSVRIIERPGPVTFPRFHFDPQQTREQIDRLGWRTVVGFQTRNPIHRAHEFIMKAALEIVDGLLLHPLVGATKRDDIPAGVRMRCYQALLDGYYPRRRTLLAVFPGSMRYAGPREAVFHALVRKNYGCTHFIVGRDHAGVGSFYGTYDAQRLFDRFTHEELGIEALAFEHTFYCHSCSGMASLKTCPHPEERRVILSGTRVREMLGAGEVPPVEFTRPEVARILIEHYANGAAEV